LRYRKKTFLPFIEEKHADGDYIFQQDGATGHTSNFSMKRLESENITLYHGLLTVQKCHLMRTYGVK